MHAQKRKLSPDKAILARIKRFEYALSSAEGYSRQSLLDRIEQLKRQLDRVKGQ